MNGYPPRSASALGAAGGYRQPPAGSAGSNKAGNHHRSNFKVASSLRDPILEPLSEDEILSSQQLQRDDDRARALLMAEEGQVEEEDQGEEEEGEEGEQEESLLSPRRPFSARRNRRDQRRWPK